MSSEEVREEELEASAGPLAGAPVSPAEPGVESAWSELAPRQLEPLRPHDFLRPRALSVDRVRALDSIHRRFARTASGALSVLARTKVQVDLIEVAQRTYSEFIRGLQNPTCLFLVYCLPERLPFVLEMKPALTFPFLERLLGGRGDGALPTARPMTRLEQDIARSIADKVLGALRECWPVGDQVRFDVVEAEHNPVLMQAVAPTEPTVVLSFQVHLGGPAPRASQLQLCFPTKPFDAILSRLANSGRPELDESGNSPEEKERILRRLGNATVELTAELASLPLTLSDLLTLQPGDVIDTGIHRQAEMTVRLGDHGVFAAQPATREGRRVVRITRSETEG